jgi:hypothetical protein
LTLNTTIEAACYDFSVSLVVKDVSPLKDGTGDIQQTYILKLFGESAHCNLKAFIPSLWMITSHKEQYSSSI